MAKSMKEIKEFLKVEKKTSSPENVNGTVFSSSLSEVKQILKKKDYNKKSVVYIDDDIAMILKQLKFKKGLQMGNLCSYLLEKFFKENKEEMNDLFKNKYL